MKSIIVVILAAIFLLAGCAGVQKKPYVINISSPYVSPFKDGNKIGTATVKGNAFLRQRGGGVVTCAGYKAGLVPLTSYAKQRIQKLYQTTDGTKLYQDVSDFAQYSGFEYRPDVPEYYEDHFEADCNSNGIFVFNNIPAGEYFVYASVYWQVGNSGQGGHVGKYITVLDGQSYDLVLTN